MPRGTATTTPPYDAMLTLQQYAKHVDVHPRTVKRWLAGEQLRGARQDPLDGHWLIPATAKPEPKNSTPGGTLVVQESGARPVAHVRDIPHAAPATQQVTYGQLRVDDVEEFPSWTVLPTMLPLHIAAALIGVSEYAIKSNQDFYGAVKHGKRGALLVPLATVKSLRGV